MEKRIGAFFLCALLLLNCMLPAAAEDLIIEEPGGAEQELLQEEQGNGIFLEIEEAEAIEAPEQTGQTEAIAETGGTEAAVSPDTGSSPESEPDIPRNETGTEAPSLAVESVTEVETKDYTGETILEECVVTVEELLQESGEAGDASFSRLRMFSAGTYTDSWGSQLSEEAASVYHQMVSAFISQNSTAQVNCTLPVPYTFTTAGTIVQNEDGNNTLQWDSENNDQYQSVRSSLTMAVQSAFDAFCYDYPEAFWLGRVKYTYGISFSGSGGIYTGTIKAVTVVPEEKYPGAFGEIGAFQSAVSAAVSRIQTALQGKTDRYYVLKAIHDYICSRVEYGENDYAHTAAGVFIKNNQVVCEGYAKAFRILAKKFGIDSPLIVGTAISGGNQEAHMWNYVQMEDGVWYLVDTTWDDQKSGIVYTYFLVGSGDQGFVYPIGQERTPYTNFSGSNATKNFALPSLGSGTYHSWETEGILKNCESGGQLVYHCRYCQKVKEETVSAGAGAHQWDSGQITVNPGCEQKGKRVYHCTRCLEGVKEEIIPAVGHTAGDWTVTEKATCLKEGSQKQVCKTCGDTIAAQTIPAAGHKAGKWTVTKEATCLEAGIRSQICSVCKAAIAAQTIPAAGHTAGDWTVTLEASCTQTGTRCRFCTECKALLESQTIQALGHDWGEYRVTKKATALKTGTQTRTCSRCRASQQESVPKLTPYIKVSATSILLKKGQSTSVLKVTGMASGDKVKSWKSSNTKIVKVSSKGKLTAQKKTGKATVTVTLQSGIKKKVTVKVQSGTVKTTRISGLPSSLRISKGKTASLKPVLKPLTSQQKITYQSSNKKVATVSSKGVIRAKGAGTARITVKSGSKKVTVKVTVPRTKTKKITKVPSSLTLKKGKTRVLRPRRSPSGSDEKITYKSSNRKVAAVTSSGKITAKKKGTAVITVKSGSVSVKCKVTVK